MVKVDVDGGPELQIVRSIAESAELSALVDELYFEFRASLLASLLARAQRPHARSAAAS